MNFLDAMKLLSEGKKVRRKSWRDNQYIVLSKKGIVDERGERVYNLYIDDVWEVYDERKEAPETLRDLFGTLIDFYNDYEEIDIFELDELNDATDNLFDVLERINKEYKLDK